MTEQTSYRIVCEELNLILQIKVLTLDEERVLFSNLRDMVQNGDDLIDINYYRKYIVLHFVLNLDTLGEHAPDPEEDEDEYASFLESLYECIISIFPMFSIEFICADINKESFLKLNGKHMSEELIKVLGHGIKPVEEPESKRITNIEEINELEEYLKDNIISQDSAIESVVRSVKLKASGLSEQCALLFVGPTGVGKTELAKLLGNKYSGNFFKINCAEYAASHEYSKLIGAPPGYSGHEKKSILAEKSEQSDAWVFLFDEIEKAHHKLYDFLLSMLDDGTCTDNLGNVLNFKNSIFIFTSNKGMDEVKMDSLGFASLKTQTIESLRKNTDETVRSSLKSHFSAEFLNRLDDVIVFNQLSKSDVKKIVYMVLEELPIEVGTTLVNKVTDEAYSVEYGARNVSRYVKTHIAPAVADAILSNKVPKNSTFYKSRFNKGKFNIIDVKDIEENKSA